MQPRIEKTLFGADEIDAVVDELARAVNREYCALEEPLLVVGLLNGAFIFMADLVRRLDVEVEVDFLSVASYGNAKESSGEVCFRMGPRRPVTGRDLLLVEDIVDTGRTLAAVVASLEQENPASIKTCTLLDKPSRREVDVAVDFIGREIPDEFVCGYGLDFAQKFRNLPYIGVLGK